MLRLARYSAPGATLGILEAEDGKTWYTVECRWAGNQPGVSCIPAGEYELVKETFATRGECWAFVGNGVGLWDEPGNERFACLIHSANVASQLAGCLAPGTRPYADSDEWGVGNSRQATAEVYEAIEADPDRRILIEWATPLP